MFKNSSYNNVCVDFPDVEIEIVQLHESQTKRIKYSRKWIYIPT